jgi:hypothetical protein
MSHHWTLGILLFEKVTEGVHPFMTSNAMLLKKMIQHYPVTFPDIDDDEKKTERDEELAHLIYELLNKQEDQRLGSEEGIDEVLRHGYFE